ncbi:MAG: hypothetical protein WBE89_08635 [Methyloceanibacter sp.]
MAERPHDPRLTHVEQIEILPDAGAATPQTPETRQPGAIVA